MLVRSFEPIVNDKSRILILGSMPGKESLIRNEYYGNRRNSFWKLMFDMFGLEYVDEYDKKIQLIQDNNIALWDVIYECERKSSLDSDIRKAILNDFNSFFAQHDIKYIFINGGKAFDLFTKKLDEGILTDRRIARLESTSPARAIPYKEKLKSWMQVKDIHDMLI